MIYCAYFYVLTYIKTLLLLLSLFIFIFFMTRIVNLKVFIYNKIGGDEYGLDFI